MVFKPKTWAHHFRPRLFYRNAVHEEGKPLNGINKSMMAQGPGCMWDALKHLFLLDSLISSG